MRADPGKGAEGVERRGEERIKGEHKGSRGQRALSPAPAAAAAPQPPPAMPNQRRGGEKGSGATGGASRGGR